MEANKEETIKMLKDLISTLEQSSGVETQWESSAGVSIERMFDEDDHQNNVRTGDFSVSFKIEYYNPLADKRKFH